VSNE